VTARLEGELCWLTVDQAARLAAASPATIRGWIRRGSLRTRSEGGETRIHLGDVVARGLARRRTTEPAALAAQAEAALDELETMVRELTKTAEELDGLRAEAAALRDRSTEIEDQYARRETWARGQHEREMREAYALWEQERSHWEQERNRLAPLDPESRHLVSVAPVADVPSAAGAVANNGHVTSRPPISDEVLPPLHAEPAPEHQPSADITPAARHRTWRRQQRS